MRYGDARSPQSITIISIDIYWRVTEIHKPCFIRLAFGIGRGLKWGGVIFSDGSKSKIKYLWIMLNR